MCSIAGFISSKRDKDTLLSMNEILSHRGVDDSGIFIDSSKEGDFIHLAHNRLSILDISFKASQPFVSSCKNYVIVYNGEVYNFREIRRELEKIGYSFVSESDTEVVLYAYKEWGEKALDRFIGMFAFAIWDRVKDILFLARDRAGVKPLYFYQKGDEFVFASELKGILEYPSFKKEINFDVIPFYLQFGYIPSPFTIFKNVSKLSAGSYMIFDFQSKAKRSVKYWDVLDFYKAPKFEGGEEDVLFHLEELLYDSAKYRTVSDVPIGIFLSGGYDSTFVAATLQSHSDKKLHTFSIGFEDKEFDESIYARDVAKHLKTYHHEHFISRKELVDIASKLAFIYDEPFADDSTIPTTALSVFTKESVKVALSGDGGDEIFCGYSKYSALYSMSSLFSSSLKKATLSMIAGMIPSSSVKMLNELLPDRYKNRNIEDKYQKFKRAIKSKDLKEMFINASSISSQKEIREVLRGDFNSVLERSAFRRFEEISDLNYLDQMMAIDYITYLTDNTLVKVDRASMSSSLEAREPLLDHRLVEFLARVPVEIKYKNSEKKYLLKKILYKYVPKELMERPKSGFRPPLYKWLREDLGFLIEIYLDESLLISSEIFDIDSVNRLKKDLKDGKNININLLWAIVVFQMWYVKWM